MSGRKIIDGLHEAIAHARGDHSVARVCVVRVPETSGCEVNPTPAQHEPKKVIERHSEVVEDAFGI